MSVTRLNVINSDNSTLQLNNISNENIRLGQGGGLTDIGSTTPFNVSSSGIVTINNTSDSSGIASGSLTTLGGLGITKKLYTGTDVALATVSGATTIGSATPISVAANGVLNVNNTTASSNLSTASAIFQGGISIANSTEATSTSQGGALTIAGGFSVAKKVFAGGNVSFASGLNMNNTLITNVADPLNDTDVATKSYVDVVAQGLVIKESVRLASTGPGTLASSFENGDTLDDIVLVTGDRILIKNQVSGIENGIYVVQATGTPLRSADFATGTSQGGSFVFVELGTQNGSTGWVVTNIFPDDVVDTDSLVFSQFSGAGQIVAGTGLTKTVNTLSVNASLTHVTAVGTLTSLTVSPGLISGVSLNLSGLTASSPVFTDASKNFVSATVTGTGTTVVLDTSPTLITPVLGVASGTSINLTSTTASTGASVGAITLLGGIGINNTTDAVSVTNGGTITTAGGASIAKKLFVGTDLTVSGISSLGATTPVIVSSTGALRIDNGDPSTSTTTGSLIVDGGAGIAGSLYASSGNFTSLSAPHSGLSGLLADDHTQYALLAGRTGGQTIIGGTASGDDLILQSTSNITKGNIIVFEDTDSSSVNTGALVVNGGLGVAKKLFVGTDLTVSGISSLGATNTVIISATGAVTIPTNLTLSALTASKPVSTNASNVLITSPTTGTGSTVVLDTSPTLVTPNIGVASGTSLNLSGTITVNGISTLGTTTGATVSAAGILVVNNTTDATSATSASMRSLGGIASSGAMWVGGIVNTDSYFFIRNVANFAPPTFTTSRSLGSKFILYPQFANGTSADYAIGIESNAIWYGVPTTAGSHKFYSGITNTMTLSGTNLNLPAFSTASTSSTTGSITIVGGIGINNATDATSSTNGGTITTAGGASIAKKLFVGTDLTVSGITSLGATNSVTISSIGAVTIPTNLTLNALTASKPVSTNASNVLITSPVTGTGSTVVLDTSPTLVTPNIGVASGTSLNLSGALTVNGLSTLGATNSVTVSAAGAVTIPTNLTLNALTASKPVSTNASNVLITSPVTGTGSTVVLDTSPTLVTPIIGAASGTSLNLTSSTATTSATTGAVTIVGGIGINNATDAVSATNGGTITTAGGAAIAKKLFVGTDTALATVSGTTTIGSTTAATISATGILTVNNATNATSATSAALVVTGGIGTSGSVFIGTKNITPNTGDITAQVTFTGVQSASAANVTGLSFNPASTRSFEVLMSVVVVATSSLFAQFKLQGIYNGVSWYFAPTYLGDNTLVTFAITNAGQVTYSSTTYTGFSSLTMKFKAVSLNI